jgi:hypothetical protein
MYQLWIFKPSGAVYHISFTSPSLLPFRMSSFTNVSCFTVCGLAMSNETMSGGVWNDDDTPTALPLLAMLDTVSM